MKTEEKQILELLAKKEYVTPSVMAKAKTFARTHGGTVMEYLLSTGAISKDVLGQALADNAGLPYADLDAALPPRDQVRTIPEPLAKKYHAVFFRRQDQTVTLATDKPAATVPADLTKLFPNQKVIFAYALGEDIDAAFIHYRKPLETRFARIIKASQRVAPEIISEMVEDALVFRASDIHIEPQEHEVVIRFRIDGVLHEAGRLTKDYYDNIVNRLKVQAHLRTDEHFAAQDGAIRYTAKHRTVDLRISVIPALDGEKVVIRLLSEYVRNFTLTDLGFASRDLGAVYDAASKPYGMIIVTGPTGAGKTTTLYGLIKMLNRPEVNIATIEDPVEYKIVGVNHMKVNPQTNLTFAQGLKSILRQDPDIILVGEIRDQDTAEISVNAALTGHVLLSTFHANDAATAIPRLTEMGVEPFLLASTLSLLVAQRLVRKVCLECKVTTVEKRRALIQRYPVLGKYLKKSTIRLTHGPGCAACNRTGFRGRTGIFEIIRITPEMEALILKRPSTAEIWALARTQGAHSLFEDGMEKVLAGVTTIDEVVRVAAPRV